MEEMSVDAWLSRIQSKFATSAEKSKVDNNVTIHKDEKHSTIHKENFDDIDLEEFLRDEHESLVGETMANNNLDVNYRITEKKNSCSIQDSENSKINENFDDIDIEEFLKDEYEINQNVALPITIPDLEDEKEDVNFKTLEFESFQRFRRKKMMKLTV